MSKDASLAGMPSTEHRQATFVVDYHESPVDNLRYQLQREYGSLPTVDNITEFVDKQIAVKTYLHGFDVASQVAEKSEGDCTEHAVLLAALARAQDMPARLAFGIILVVDRKDVQAFGHAWAEVYESERWRIADATRPERLLPSADYFYLPLFTMGDEGPGYTMELMRFATLRPSRIVVAPSTDLTDLGLKD